jgi:hypothetical protein
MRDAVPFEVTDLHAAVPEGIPFRWHGMELSSGPLAFKLDRAWQSFGVMNYAARKVSVRYHVALESPALIASFCALGVSRDMVVPLRAVLDAEGGILEDHGFDGGIRGRCEIGDIGLLAPGERLLAEVLPGS